MYKAFVSSTFEDLHLHRAEIIRTLQAAGFQIDPMESWQADREAPHQFSADRLKGCMVCILLVAFRRGHIPSGELRSITQIEYDEARRRRIDVLPFLLAEQTSVGDTGWNPKFDERRSDAEINQWRKILRQTHGVGEFGPDPKSARIEAALARWVVQAESDRAQRFRRAITFALGGLFLLLAVGLLYLRHIYETPELRGDYHSRFLAFHDPITFSYAKNGQYAIARVLANRGSFKDTNLTEELGATRSSFDMLVNNAQYIRHEQNENFRNILKKGGRLRIILWDYSQENKVYNEFHLAIGQEPGESREGARNVHYELDRLRQDVEADPKTYPGKFEFRWNPRPLLYTMWVRDWDNREGENALGHLGIHFYQGQAYWPSFRVSFRDGKELIDNMHNEFEYIWANSFPSIPVKMN